MFGTYRSQSNVDTTVNAVFPDVSFSSLLQLYKEKKKIQFHEYSIFIWRWKWYCCRWVIANRKSCIILLTKISMLLNNESSLEVYQSSQFFFMFFYFNGQAKGNERIENDILFFVPETVNGHIDVIRGGVFRSHYEIHPSMRSDGSFIERKPEGRLAWLINLP